MLNADQATFFARNGFLQLSSAVPAESCAHLVAETWRLLPKDWRPDDPASWRGEVMDSCHTADLVYRRGHLKFQQKGLVDDSHVVGSFQDPSPVHAIAHALIGKPLHRIRLRGLYAIAPTDRSLALRPIAKPHVEAHPAQIVALCYLADVKPGGGGLLVWPGSHRSMYAAFDSKLDFVANAAYEPLMHKAMQRQPLELAGGRGDVVLIHHRLLHAPSLNRSSAIRFGFLCDYTPLDYRELCRQPPGRDLWEDWPGLARLAGDRRDDPSTYEWQGVGESKPDMLQAAPATQTASSKNKSDASVLARMKRAGDIWLSVSDCDAMYDQTHSLDPHGGDLISRGTRVFLNGTKLSSLSKGDITVRLAPNPGDNTLTVRGIDGPLWIRIVEIRLPFIESRIIHRCAVSGSQEKVSFCFSMPDSGPSTHSQHFNVSIAAG